MRSSEILQPLEEHSCKWEASRDTNISRITWGDVNHAQKHGCKTCMRWSLKPSEGNKNGKKFKKTLVVQGDRTTISAGFKISSMHHLRGFKHQWDLINTPLLWNPNAGKDVTIERSRKRLAQKVKEVGLSQKNFK